MSTAEARADGRFVEVRVRRVLEDGGAERQRDAGVFCVERQCSLRLEECMSCERCNGLRHDSLRNRSLVVCGDGQEAPSALASGFRAGSEDAPALTSVSAVMGTEVICIRKDLAADTVARMLADGPVGVLPVVDQAGAPIGIVSRTDMFRRLAEEGDTVEVASAGRAALGGGLHEDRWADQTAGDFMTPVVLTLTDSSTVAQAAAFMAYERIHQIPVVSERGDLVGLVTSLDVLRWIAHRSGYLVPAPPSGDR